MTSGQTDAARFRCVRDIDSSRTESWEDRLFLTLDIDWAHDDVLADTLDVIEGANVSATWFVTHDTPLLARLRANPGFELGIHPNFNFLLDGDPRSGASAEEVVDRLLGIVPEAVSVRSHSTTLNTGLLSLFARKGLRHDCNLFVPAEAGITLKPWSNWTGMTMVPYFWEDDVAFMSGVDSDAATLACHAGLKVFDFHPIHVFLNTERPSRYEAARGDLANPGGLARHRNPGRGTRSFLEQLVGIA